MVVTFIDQSEMHMLQINRTSLFVPRDEFTGRTMIRDKNSNVFKDLNNNTTPGTCIVANVFTFINLNVLGE